jgi:hypothetical protein
MTAARANGRGRNMLSPLCVLTGSARRGEFGSDPVVRDPSSSIARDARSASTNDVTHRSSQLTRAADDLGSSSAAA